MRHCAWIVLLLGVTSVMAQPASTGSGQAYPARPIRIIVPQSPGASTDITARLVAQGLNEAFRQPVIVDNRPGSSGIAGTELVARAAPDGYTLMVVASSFAINPALGRKMPFDSIRDFTTITQLSKFPNMLAAHPSAPVKTLQDVIALAKAKPGQLNYASAGLATGTHMTVELLKFMTGIELLHVPYKGGRPGDDGGDGRADATRRRHVGWPVAAREGGKVESDCHHQRPTVGSRA